MSDETRDAEEDRQPLTRRDARDGTPADGVPLADAAFPTFDAEAIPPRPPLPASAGGGTSVVGGPLDTADHNAIREQWRAARDELENHVSHARDQIDQANERIKQRTGRDLVLAILIGLAFGAALLASLLFVKALFVPFALAAALLGVYELSRALRASGRRIDVIPQLVAGAFLVLSAYFAEPWLSWVMLFVAVAFVIVWRLIAQMVAKDGRTYGDVLADAVISGFVQVYVPFLAGVALILLEQEGGQWWVLSFIAIAVAADTGAYAAGLAFGRHPMAPKISPKKTWEGFGGAVLASLVAGVLLAIFLLELPWWAGVVFGVSILLSATLGDLGESMLKRDLGIKDMSSWLPGHGGLLDRLDSILPSTIPALGLYFLLSPWVVL
ncbi:MULTISPECIES: phosphatidate cytidylyltransferase [unclassified Microbacterium]|uniref:phosphatidate cytidylyltransferase n=1 Tax=unclassified Microbacterium TaxID=2609290 RepID=UPI00109D79D8|nr:MULTISPECIES: phosphatidate cytidylyltransferase [unclassified Microbacterium]